MSSFNAEKFVEWKRKKNLYSFKQLPKTVIISAQEFSFKKITNFFTKKIKGISGKHFLFSKDILLSTGFGVGAPALISLCEELRVLGVENFYFIGLAGRLIDTIQEAEVFEISKAISELGITNSYSNNETSVSSIKANFNFDYKETISWSTDSPFRETSEKIIKYKKMGAKLVDMESASLYSFADFYKLKAICFLVSADLSSENIWQEVNDYVKIENELQFIVKQIANKI